MIRRPDCFAKWLHKPQKRVFSEKPEKFFLYTQIDVVFFRSPDRDGSDDFTEKTFTGSIQNQVREVLEKNGSPPPIFETSEGRDFYKSP